MRFQHFALVLRMELSADEPFQSWYFNYLDKVAFRVTSHALHTVTFILGDEPVVELIAVAVAFHYVVLFINVYYS